jgi:hypothetical protein
MYSILFIIIIILISNEFLRFFYNVISMVKKFRRRVVFIFNLGYTQDILGKNYFHLQPSWCHKGDIFFHAMVFWGLSNPQSHFVPQDN